MTDIAERLNEYATGHWLPEDLSDLLMEAADEIERLRGAVMGRDVTIIRQNDEIERLREVYYPAKNSTHELEEENKQLRDDIVYWSDKLTDAHAEIRRLREAEHD